MPIEVASTTGSVLSLDQAKQHLNITSTTNDAEVQVTIDAAEARLSQEVGPLSGVDKSARVSTAGAFLLLPSAPVQSLTSITDVRASEALDLTLLTLDGEAGTVYYTDGNSLFRSPAYDVAFRAGWSTVPADLMYAIKELVRHLWQTQRGNPMISSLADQAPIGAAPAGFALPNRVMEMIEPYRQSVVG